MRSTRASAAIERLNKRDTTATYSMAFNRQGLFTLLKVVLNQDNERLCEPMDMDAFVIFVNGYGPQMPKRVSKLELAFSQQLNKS
jgi:hypothetical protein